MNAFKYSSKFSAVVSIPILILRKAKIKLRQKLVMGLFLCLSFAMVVVALTRISEYRLSELDIVWQLFWMYMEACIALIMASLKTFRTAFVTIAHKKKEEEKKGKPSSFIRQRLMARLNRRSRMKELEKNENNLPAIPGATLTGMRTFIQQNNHSVDGTRSEYNRLDESHHSNEAEMNSNLERAYFSAV